MKELFTKRFVDEHPIVIYTKEGCGYCEKAKKLLSDREKEEITIITPKQVTRLKQLLTEENDGEWVESFTYPVVFVGGEYIGGYRELKDNVKRGTFT